VISANTEAEGMKYQFLRTSLDEAQRLLEH